MWKTNAILITEFNVHRERAGRRSRGCAPYNSLPSYVYNQLPLLWHLCAVDHVLFWLSCCCTHQMFLIKSVYSPVFPWNHSLQMDKVFTFLSLAIKVWQGLGGWQGCRLQLLQTERHLKRGDMTIESLSSEPGECLCTEETLFRYQGCPVSVTSSE